MIKKFSFLIIIFIIFHIIIFPIASDYFICFSSFTCMAAERITPYKPQVRYSESYAGFKLESAKEIKTTPKRKVWPWVVGGIVIIGAVLGAGGSSDSGRILRLARLPIGNGL